MYSFSFTHAFFPFASPKIPAISCLGTGEPPTATGV